MALKTDPKFAGKLTWAFKNDMRSYVSWHCYGKELCFMTLESDAEFEEKLACGLENDMSNLANFYHSTWKSQNWDFDGILLSKVEKVWASNLQRSYVSWQWRTMQNLKSNWLVLSKLTPQLDKFWPEHLNVSQICTLMGSFRSKHIMFEPKKHRKIMFDGTEDWFKICRKTDLGFQKWHEELIKFSQTEKQWFYFRK